MIPDKYIELMNKEIDGVSTAAESDELRRLLESDAGAARWYAELRESLQIFERAGMVQPPAGLRERIAAAAVVDARSRGEQPHAVSRPARTSRLRPGHAVAFAGGLIAATLLFVVLWGDERSGDVSGTWPDLYGSAPAERAAAGAGILAIDLPGLTGEVRAVPTDGGTVVRVALRGDGAPTTVSVTSRDGRTCEAGRVLSAGDEALALSGSRAEIRLADGGAFDLFFRHHAAEDPDLLFEVRRDGRVVLAEEIPPARR
jgi:hypothetical protein